MIIDLCSGISERWPSDEETVKIDINRETKPDIVADIRYLPLKPGLRPRLCHASPPCEYISKARKWRWGYNPKGIAESFEMIASVYRAFEYLQAEYCSFENPAGLESFLGHKIQFRYDKADIKNTTTNFYLNKKSQRRAIIPKDVKQQILDLTFEGDCLK